LQLGVANIRALLYIATMSCFAVDHTAASTSQMGRFETEVLTLPENQAALRSLPGKRIERLRQRMPMKMLILDLDCPLAGGDMSDFDLIPGGFAARASSPTPSEEVFRMPFEGKHIDERYSARRGRLPVG